MQPFLERLDSLAGVAGGDRTAIWLERGAFVFLVLMTVAAPHSIAATQTAWLTGMFLWIARLFVKPRPRLTFGLLDIALWAFFLWSVITSLTSYAPDISVNKLRGAAVFLIFYFVFYNLRNRRAATFLVYVLIASCMVNVLWMPVQRLIGRGVEIHGLAAEGPIAKALLWEGDTLLEANGKKVRTPEDVLAAIEQNEVTKVKFYRPDFDFAVDVKRSDLLSGGDAMTRLGISSWKKSRNWRSSGFYGHYTTYAEVLQLIGSLVLGLFVANIRSRLFQQMGDGAKTGAENARGFRVAGILLVALALMAFALLLTVTRGPQLAFLISAAVIVVVGLGRKWLLAAGAVGLPLALVGLIFLQQSREVGFFDPNDDSTRWRLTVWREGLDLWTSSARNFVLGIGMDSIKRFATEWRMFDDGRLNIGHFHSTPLNLVVERGLPALLLWLMVLGVYARTLWKALRVPHSAFRIPHSAGFLLGCLGGAVGFFTSGLVHYNLGDQEVAMIFFLLMGVGVRIAGEQE